MDFLTSSHRVFSKLAAGAQAGKSSAWYGRIKRERKNDDLLAYMQQARHADEHGLEKIADASGGALQINPANYNAPLKVNDMVIEGGALKKLDAENASLKFVPADAILRPVKNEGREYPPPSRHLDKPWTANNAQAVAKATLEYMGKMITDGEAYVVD